MSISLFGVVMTIVCASEAYYSTALFWKYILVTVAAAGGYIVYIGSARAWSACRKYSIAKRALDNRDRQQRERVG